MWAADTSPLFSFQFPRISTLYFTGKLGQMSMWGNFSICVCVSVCARARQRKTLCVSLLLCFIFHHRHKERQIKKLYSNWYDQGEHLSQISNIENPTINYRLGNKAGPFSSTWCLICCERDGAGSGWMCTTQSALYNRTGRTEQKDGACAYKWEIPRHTVFCFLFFLLRWPARVTTHRCRLITVNDRRYQKILLYKKPQSIKQFCLQQMHLPRFTSIWSYFTPKGKGVGGWGGRGGNWGRGGPWFVTLFDTPLFLSSTVTFDLAEGTQGARHVQYIFILWKQRWDQRRANSRSSLVGLAEHWDRGNSQRGQVMVHSHVLLLPIPSLPPIFPAPSPPFQSPSIV